MGAQFGTNALPSPWYEATDVVVFKRRPQTGTNALGEPMFGPPVTVYSGLADFQENAGDELLDAVGVVPEADGVCIIDAVNGTQADVQIGDQLTYAGATYLVVNISTFSLPPAHIEVLVKRGKSW
jgi:hypothetical protein